MARARPFAVQVIGADQAVRTTFRHEDHLGRRLHSAVRRQRSRSGPFRAEKDTGAVAAMSDAVSNDLVKRRVDAEIVRPQAVIVTSLPRS